MNELLLVIEAAVCALLVVVTWRFALERLYAVIAIFLILIANLGGKIIEVFGHATNTGNIFYAAVFLATYFIIERNGKREGIYSIWIGVIAVAVFFVLVQITVAMVGSPTTAVLNNALPVAYSPFSQITVASLIAYVVSQNLNVYLYTYLKRKINGSYLWVRANVSNVLAQIVDSALFFTIAFWGLVPPGNIWDILITGFAIKVIFVAVTSPLLFLNRIEQEDGRDFSKISIR
jgi:queuosine precursor transporter